MKKYQLTGELETALTAYVDDVLSRPIFYINPTHDSTEYEFSRVLCDPTDQTYPGVSDEFILNHDLNSLNWRKSILDVNVVSKLSEISFPPVAITKQLMEYVETVTGLKVRSPSGNFLYPKGGFMGWHTNSNAPCYRLYIAYSPIENGSYFKYIKSDDETKTIVTDWDNKGWTVRLFEITNSSYFWHCVYSPNAPRISFGFRLD